MGSWHHSFNTLLFKHLEQRTFLFLVNLMTFVLYSRSTKITTGIKKLCIGGSLLLLLIWDSMLWPFLGLSSPGSPTCVGSFTILITLTLLLQYIKSLNDLRALINRFCLAIVVFVCVSWCSQNGKFVTKRQRQQMTPIIQITSWFWRRLYYSCFIVSSHSH